MMYKEDIIFFEKLIQRKLEEAKNELIKIKKEIEEDENSDSFAILMSQQTKYITSLENSLVRIKNGTFGFCSKTGEEIDLERLKLVPNSELSSFAKEVYNENKKKQKE